MHIAQRDQQAKNTQKLRDVREINQGCSFLWLPIQSSRKKSKSDLIRR
jgi:hypothetical protein